MVREVYEHIYDTVDVGGSEEVWFFKIYLLI